MKLTTPFTILNRKLNEMDLIRDAMQKRKLATEDCMMIIEKCSKTKNIQPQLMDMFNLVRLN